MPEPYSNVTDDTGLWNVAQLREEDDGRDHSSKHEALVSVDRWWRAANYLSVGQIYLMANALLQEPLRHEDTKPRLLGHWGTTPGLNFIYAHMNRAIVNRELSVMFLAGPGHGGPGVVANSWLEGTYSELYPNITFDSEGMTKLFRQFSFPGGIPSHAAPETPGSIHEGGELGYVLSHAFGAVFDNPDLIALAVVGDGEAETGPLATGWHGNKFLNPARDGAVLPVLHLNGFKIASPTFLARIPGDELEQLLRGYGWEPYFVEGHQPAQMHRQMAAVVDRCLDSIRDIQEEARTNGNTDRPRWPMIVLRSPKGWTCPAEIDGLRTEGSWRSHQVPLTDLDTTQHLALLDSWLRSYNPQELFDESGVPYPSTIAISPKGPARMSANPHANGGVLLHDLDLPEIRSVAVQVDAPGSVDAEATRIQGKYLAEVMRRNMERANFRVFSPDELASNRWQDIFEVTARCFVAAIEPDDDHLSPTGRVMEVLSEHQCEGWLEGYLLTGRHGIFSCYEAFIHIVDSMFNQHAKWLKVCREIAWRAPIASLNFVLTSHVWRQDHNGYSHQDPGFLDHVVNKKAEIIRVYLPPDANTLLAVTDECLRSRDKINVVVAGKQPAPQWLGIDDAITHVERGLGIWSWASSDHDSEPDVVMACCGDVPTMEALAAVSMLRELLPDIRIRFVNVVDLMRLQDEGEHPHGLSHTSFDQIFTTDKPVIFAFHGYPSLIHKLTYRRTNHANVHVRGYKEEGTTTTPFDMLVLNDLDRYHLAIDVIDRVRDLGTLGAEAKQYLIDQRLRHKRYIVEHGEDMPEIREWRWGSENWDQRPVESATSGTQGNHFDATHSKEQLRSANRWLL